MLHIHRKSKSEGIFFYSSEDQVTAYRLIPRAEGTPRPRRAVEERSLVSAHRAGRGNHRLLQKRRHEHVTNVYNKESEQRTSHNGGTSTRCTNTTSPHGVRTHPFEPVESQSRSSESPHSNAHRSILEHIWHDKEPNHASPDVDLI